MILHFINLHLCTSTEKTNGQSKGKTTLCMVSTHDRFGYINRNYSCDLQLGKHSETIIKFSDFFDRKLMYAGIE